jgi:competence protein ComEC
MLACFVIVGLSGRKCGSARIFLLAATTVLLANPLAAVGSGFWLSFGAVAALLWFARWQHGLSAFRGLLQTQGFMSLIMLPLGASFFGGGSLVAMPANLLMIPLIGWIVVPTGLLAVVSFLCGWPMELALWHISAWPLEKLLPLATALAVEGRNWLYLPLTANPGEVLLAVLGIALLALPTRAGSKLLAVIVTMPMLLPLATPPATPSLNTEITVLDVGQGAAVVVRSGHRALVYDTGGGDPEGVNMGSMVVLPYLRYRGISSLDTLVISHPDLDHSAGTAVVRNALAVERFRYGGERPVVGGGRPCIAGESWRWPGGQVFQFLSPAEEILPRSNDSSCVLLVQVGDYRLLLTGDIEAERERALVLYWDAQLRSDWLLAAHHGSNTSSSLTFLKQVQPKVVVISSGYANRFGHPHPLTIRRLTDLQPTIYSTATGGALTFSLTPGQVLQVDAHRRTVRRYWM